MNVARALVLRAPGINCERETAYACRQVGFETDLIHINHLLKQPAKLLDYHFLVLPGGFSYGDDLGAGTLLAKQLSVHLAQELQQFIAEGRPVLGICNGFQVLVRAGLLPGTIGTQNLAATLTDNVSAHYECRWVAMAAPPSPCLFTRNLPQPFELPVGHGEGQFVLAQPAELAQLQTQGQIALLYTNKTASGRPEEIGYPANPNGSFGHVAAVCNTQGNVMGMMPHPDRFLTAMLHPQRRHEHGPGDGLLIFQNAYTYVQEQQKRPQEDAAPDVASSSALSYAASGVNIAAADSVLDLIKDAVRATHGPEVQAGLGAFAGVFSATSLQAMRKPALVASTDGVGTKTLLASAANCFEHIGYDLVNHSINDLLTQKATPLFFMDYVATGQLLPEQTAAIVKSVAAACQEVGCALLGGETAEMPGVYHQHAFDLAGTIVGAVDLADDWHNGANVCVGDVLLGLPSTGLHTNGYTLARRIFASYPLDTVWPELGEPLAAALLRPHRSYVRELAQLHQHISIKGLAHITGGGFPGNVARILPAHTQAVIDTHAWPVPPLFQLLARLGQVAPEEMYRTFNMGIGMVLVVAPEVADEARAVLPELLTVGSIAEGSGVHLQGV